MMKIRKIEVPLNPDSSGLRKMFISHALAVQFKTQSFGLEEFL